MDNQMPTFDELMNPLLKAIRDLGGSGSVDEIYEKVAENLNVPEEVLTQLHNSETGNTTEIEYRLAWARTYLKKYGLLENSARGVWAISQNKATVHEVDSREVVQFVRNADREQRIAGQGQNGQELIESPEAIETPEEIQSWRANLHKILTRELDPTAFERLVKDYFENQVSFMLK